MMKRFTDTEIKDIQAVWLKKYGCSEEEIQKVIDGGINITQDIRQIASKAVAEFEAKNTDKPVAAISTATVDTLMRKDAWSKEKPRKKATTVIEEPYDLNVPAIYPHNIVLDNADTFISQPQDAQL